MIEKAYLTDKAVNQIAEIIKEPIKAKDIEIKALRDDNNKITQKFINIINNLEQEIERLNNIIKEVREWIRIVQTNEDKKHLEPIINTDELDHILEILDKGE